MKLIMESINSHVSMNTNLLMYPNIHPSMHSHTFAYVRFRQYLNMYACVRVCTNPNMRTMKFSQNLRRAGVRGHSPRRKSVSSTSTLANSPALVT